MTFASMWDELRPIGRDTATGGYRRFSFGPAERSCVEWFRSQAAARSMAVDSDGNGNLVAWWRPDGCDHENPVVTGSHLDSVPDGGAYDGPLGIVSAYAVLDLLRDKGFRPTRAIGVAAFVEEEGARFGLPCLGSRLMTGAADPVAAGALTDADGGTLVDAMRAAGLEPALGPSALLRNASAYVELHVEQGRALDVPVGIATAIWAHGRWRFDVTGAADHAGTTRLSDRRDPMLTVAEAVLAARKKAARHGAVTTFGRVEVEPGATNAIPRRVRAWLDARAPDEATLDRLVAELTAHSTARAARDGTRLDVITESRSPAVTFAGDVTDRIASLLPGATRLPTGAGHDAAVLAAAGIPSAMLFVRNPTGVSHAPAESATPADCAAGVDALAAVLAELAG